MVEGGGRGEGKGGGGGEKGEGGEGGGRGGGRGGGGEGGGGGGGGKEGDGRLHVFVLQYGVAMIGNGVSTVVSLRLPRAVEEAG